MEDWVTLEEAEKNAKSEKEKRKVFRTILKKTEKASIAELDETLNSTNSKLIEKQIKLELWWRSFSKDPEKLLEFIETATDKDKISRAIIELGEIKHRNATNTIIKFLDDMDLRDSAALALREMPTQEAFKPLIQSIKKNPDGSECLLYALELLDCSDAAELLVDLFILKPNAPVVRYDIYVCFSEGAVKRIPKEVKEVCCSKLLGATEEPRSPNDTKELKQLYDLVNQIEEV